jgi:hypothetical protein
VTPQSNKTKSLLTIFKFEDINSLFEAQASLNSVLTSKKTQHFTITKINLLMLIEEIIPVYSENDIKPINTLCGQNAELLIVEAGGTYSYHWVLKG